MSALDGPRAGPPSSRRTDSRTGSRTGPGAAPGRIVRRPGPLETRPETAHRRRRALEVSLAVAVPLLLVLAWQLAATRQWIDARVYPAPSAILADGWERAAEGELWPDVWATLKRVLAGYALGTVSGYLLGLLMGALPLVRAALEPAMDALYVVPKLALLPVFLNMFGLGEGPRSPWSPPPCSSSSGSPPWPPYSRSPRGTGTPDGSSAPDDGRCSDTSCCPPRCHRCWSAPASPPVSRYW